jgi:hypothetical protein
LDALIAEKVMADIGWDIVIEGCSRGGRACPTLADAEKYREALSRHYHVGDIVLHGDVPCYSTDIAAAWRVVEKLRADGWTMEFTNQDRPALAFFWRTHHRLDGVARSAATASLAICLAALATVDARAVSTAASLRDATGGDTA